MRRILVVVVGLVIGLGLMAGPATAAKQCKKGQAVAVVNGKAKCVKKCPKGLIKKKQGKQVRCVKAKQAPPAQDENQGTQPTDETTDPGPTVPAFDPLAKYTDIVRHMYLLRTYQVPKPGAHNGYNTHSEKYAWCNHPTDGRIMVHHYEGIAYIYESAGHYEILSGEASEDGTSGSGVIRYTQEAANFDEERGKTLDIQISWQDDTATVVHPEIGTYTFAKSVRSDENC